MSTPQAVWPAELMDRRRRVLDVERRIRSATTHRTVAAQSELSVLRAELAQLPCPHWDVELDDVHGAGTWSCTDCQDTIAPMWVPAGDQERALRRAAHQRATHRPDRG